MKITAAGDEPGAWCDDQPVLTARPCRIDLDPPAVTLDEATAVTGPRH